jgi:hypothetical protein
MEVVRQPAELTNIGPWLAFIAALTADVAAIEALAAVFRGEPQRLLLHGNGPLVSASEFNLDLLRSLCSTLSGRFNGGLDDALPEPAIRYHPALHRCDLPRLLSKAEAEPAAAFFVVAMDCTVAAQGWTVAGLAGTAALPQPTLALLKWCHCEWQLSDVADRLAVIERWSHNLVGGKPALKVIR